jgi:hypothetical protein
MILKNHLILWLFRINITLITVQHLLIFSEEVRCWYRKIYYDSINATKLICERHISHIKSKKEFAEFSNFQHRIQMKWTECLYVCMYIKIYICMYITDGEILSISHKRKNWENQKGVQTKCFCGSKKKTICCLLVLNI